jgi:hypothetical protein
VKNERKEISFDGHWQSGFDKQIDDRAKRQKSKNQPKAELQCASGGKCEGICRELHLHKPRYAGVKSSKKGDSRGTPVPSQWAERCPSAHEKPNRYRT